MKADQSGELDLGILLKNLSPQLNEGIYVFCTTTSPFPDIYQKTICHFQEAEGLTIVLSKENADKLNLKYYSIMAWITLKVHSSLEAVGLTAVVSSALAKENISCNVVAAYHHDHIFVPIDVANQAIQILNQLSNINDQF